MALSANNKQWFEIRFWIREARNLENRKLIGNNAPFVEVSLDSEIKRTACTSDLNNPKWNEKLIFQYNKWEDLPQTYSIKVKDENTLLPNPLLGEYNGKFDNVFGSYHEQPNKVIQDGFISLQNCDHGELDVQLIFKFCNEFEPTLESDFKKETNEKELEIKEKSKKEMEQVNMNENERPNKSREEKIETRNQDETYLLNPVQVEAKPTVIEKEVEFHKPVEIDQTIIHQEKPIIKEQPIIKEKYERYEEKPEIERTQQEIVEECVHEQDAGNLDQQTLENLRKQRKEEFMDTKPIVQYEKENVQLDTDYRQQPTKIQEKEVVYQQPIEIEKRHIEQIKPKISEHVVWKKKHVYQKLPPEIQQADVQVIEENNEERR